MSQDQRAKMSVFRWVDAEATPITGAMSPERDSSDAGAFRRATVGVESALGQLVDAGIEHGAELRTLFQQSDGHGFSLNHAWFKAHFIVPRHSHDVDCLYYVLAGTAVLGSRTLEPGDGFFVPAEHPYAFNAGPEGVEVLEFRHATTFSSSMRERRPGRWAEILEVVRANRDDWIGEAVAPSRRQ